MSTEKAVYYPEDKKFLLNLSPHVSHYEVLVCTAPQLRTASVAEAFWLSAAWTNGEGGMNRERALKIVLVLVGLIFLFGVYPLMMYLWPSGWRWQPNQPEYEQMILGVYATLGIFLLLPSRNPSANRSLIAFTAWSSLVHAAIMAVQAFRQTWANADISLGDVPALVIVGVALIAFSSGEAASGTSLSWERLARGL